MENLVDYCNSMIKNNHDLNYLFKSADDLIGYHLNNSFDPADFFRSLAILGGEDLPRVIIICMRHFNEQGDFDELLDQGVNEDFVNKLIFIVAKYKAKFNDIIDNDNNPYGWQHLTSSVVSNGKRNYLEIGFKLNNNEEFLIQDEPSDYIDLIFYVLSKIKTMKKTLFEDELERLEKELRKLRNSLDDF